MFIFILIIVPKIRSKSKMVKQNSNARPVPAYLEQKIYLMLYKLSKLQCSRLFVNPVDGLLYKDYHALIMRPMDLTTIISKLKQGHYLYMQDIYDDLMLICKNCYLYNRDKHNSQEVHKLLAKFIRSMDLAWMGLKKELSEHKLDQTQKLITGVELSSRILQIQQKIHHSAIRKLEKWSNSPKNGNRPIQAMSNPREQQKQEQSIKIENHQNQISNLHAVQPIAISDQNEPSFGQQSKGSQIKDDPQERSEENHNRSEEEERTVSMKRPILMQALQKQKQDDGGNSKVPEAISDMPACLQDKPIVKENDSKLEDKGSVVEIVINKDLVEQEMEMKARKKLRKYQKLLQNYLKWIMDNLMGIRAKNVCIEHRQSPDSGSECQQCNKFGKEERVYAQLRKLKSYHHLYGLLIHELQSLRNGDINLKKLLALLEQFNLWLKLLAAPYIYWRLKQSYLEIQKCILVCLSKIIQYKKLGTQFTHFLEQFKRSSNNKGCQQNTQRRITRSRGNILQLDCSANKVAGNQSFIKHLNAKQRHNLMLTDQKLSKHSDFFQLLEEDQCYCSLKIIIFRDPQEPAKLKILDKDEYFQRKRKLHKKKLSQKREECSGLQVETEEEPEDEVALGKMGRIFRRPKLSRIQKQLQEKKEQEEKANLIIEEDMQFLETYSLRSNVLVIQKFREKLQLDWEEKWRGIWGVPQCLRFEGEGTNEDSSSAEIAMRCV